jgi:hypothetical protein
MLALQEGTCDKTPFVPHRTGKRSIAASSSAATHLRQHYTRFYCQPQQLLPYCWAVQCFPPTSRALKPLRKGGDLFPCSFGYEAALRERVSQRKASEHEQDERLRITPQEHVGHGSPRRRYHGLISCDGNIVLGGTSAR